MTDFIFSDVLPHRSGREQSIRFFPIGVKTKEALMNAFAYLFDFPEYFGNNWDAFHDVFPDWDRRPEISDIFLVHQDLPLENDPDNLKVYLGILSEAINGGVAGKTLRVSFPENSKTHIEHLMRETDTAL
jgi:RNAse (barnase) inhibitor barstar